MKVLLSAYACEPHKSSEPGVGWYSATNIGLNHQLWVFTAEEHRTPIEREIAVNPLPNVNFVYVKIPRWLTFWKKGERGRRIHYYMWQVAAYFAARKLHRDIHLDLVHHVTYVSYWTPSFLSLLSIPFIWGPIGGGESTPKSFLPAFSSGGLRFERMRDLVRSIAEKFDPFLALTARHADLTLATSSETEERIKALGCENVRIITEVVFAQEDIERLQEYPEYATNEVFHALSIGRLIDWKGFHLGMRAFAKMHEKFPDSKYTVIGTGYQAPTLKLLAEELGIADCVHFTGLISREDVLNFLANASVLIHPSLHDAGGWVCVEAMAIGRPVVCLDLGGPGQQIDSSVGFSMPAETPEQAIQDMADALLALATDDELGRKLGREGRRRVNETHSWAQRRVMLSEIYDDIVNQ
jgi:glycosyltransferase involved in cell wall biosynthesis